MGMAAILVMWPGRFEQFFVPPTPGGYIWNLVTIGPVVSEEKSFEIVDGRRTTTDDGACLYHELPRSLRLRWAKNSRIELKGIVLSVPSNQTKVTFIITLPFNLVHLWFFSCFTEKLKENVGGLLGGGAKPMLPPPPPPLSQIIIIKSGVLGSIPGLATYFRFSFRFFKKGSCQLLATVCARTPRGTS